MKIKVSDYIANFFAEKNIDTVFTVVGGGAMHLNDSFGHHPKLHCVYQHHEQACAMAAEGYARVAGKPALVCVTSGPGAINALNGVAGAYQDSIPMLVVSGQCKSTLTVAKNNLKLRTLGPQEFNIIPALGDFTKYAVSLMDVGQVAYELEKAYTLAVSGRPGPTWVEVPVDIQGTMVETDELVHYTCPQPVKSGEEKYDTDLIAKALEKIINAKRPVIYAGNGVRVAGACDKLRTLASRFGIPVATCWDSIDLAETESQYYVGRAGIMGDRAGNFAVQNSDLVLAIGNRLNTYQVGYNIKTWAREAYVIDVDIDPLELTKPTIRVDLPVCMDADDFIAELLEKAGWIDSAYYSEWVKQCNLWKEKYPVVSEEQRKESKPLNVYGFIDRLGRFLPGNAITVVANGSASVVGSAAYFIKERQRFIMNCAISSMGYDLPAAIGACVANDRQQVICLAGDGSIQMNIQELQTIVTNRLPVKIILISNGGYHQIRLTQTNLFHSNYVGIGPESRDLGFPDFGKLAYAYGIPYRFLDAVDQEDQALKWLLDQKEFAMLEVACSTTQIFEPKSATKRLEDGTLVSPPLEDLAPFLPREELEQNMLIKSYERD